MSSILVQRVLFLQKSELVHQQFEVVRQLLQRQLPDLEVQAASCAEDVLEDSPFDAVISPTLPWLPEVLHKVHGVQWVHFLSSGVDAIWNMDYRWDELLLTKSSGVHSSPMSEFVLGAMLHFVKRFGQFRDQQRDHCWRREWLEDLTGKQLVVLGLGAVGRELARRARAFEMRITGVSRGGQPVENVDAVVPLQRVHSLLPHADFLAVLLPLTRETKGVVGDEFLRSIKPGAILIDVSRGGVVQERAVVRAIRQGLLGGAALDVFENEPLPADSELWELPNVLLTPHVAGTCPDYLERAVRIFLANWESVRSGQGPLTAVDLAAKY